LLKNVARLQIANNGKNGDGFSPIMEGEGMDQVNQSMPIISKLL
jgi:hypothetical protein